MKSILTLLSAFLLFTIAATAQAGSSFTFSTDSMMYGPKIKTQQAQKHTAIIVKNGNLVTLYEVSFFCSNGSHVVTEEQYVIKKEIKAKQFTASTKMYEASINGENAIVIIDKSMHLAIFYAYADLEDRYFFK